MNDTQPSLVRRQRPGVTRSQAGASRHEASGPGVTRDRLLDVAERLFMEHGLEATSLRSITAQAKANLAAVNYHFGSKEALVQAVFKRRLDRLNEERLARLDALEAAAAGKPLKPSKILEAFFGTLLHMAKEDPQAGPTFLKLLGRTLTDPTAFIRTFLADEYQHVLERYKAALFKALPDVPQSEIIWRFHFMLGATAYAIAGTDSLRLVTQWPEPDASLTAGDARRTHDIDQLTQRLMGFLIGGLRAPLPKFVDTPERKTS